MWKFVWHKSDPSMSPPNACPSLSWVASFNATCVSHISFLSRLILQSLSFAQSQPLFRSMRTPAGTTSVRLTSGTGGRWAGYIWRGRMVGAEARGRWAGLQLGRQAQRLLHFIIHGNIAASSAFWSRTNAESLSSWKPPPEQRANGPPLIASYLL